jgi:hypothetical protein
VPVGLAALKAVHDRLFDEETDVSSIDFFTARLFEEVLQARKLHGEIYDCISAAIAHASGAGLTALRADRANE